MTDDVGASTETVTIQIGTSEQILTGRRSRDIVSGLEQAIGHGKLQPGQALPSVRALAAELGVSPATVAAAYRMLGQRGAVEVRSKRTVVRMPPVQTVIDRWWIHRPASAKMLSLSLPDPQLLPRIDEKFLARAMHGYGHPVKSRADACIDADLTTALSRWFTKDGVPADHLLLFSGYLDGLKRCLQHYLRHGDVVAIEDPNEDVVIRLATHLGLRLIPVQVDDDGPDPQSLRAALDANARAVMTTSRAHHPTGATVSAERSAELRDILSNHRDTVLIELDRGHGTSTSPIRSLTNITSHWVHIRSFDWAFGADLRIAPASADQESQQALRANQRDDIEWISFLSQRFMLEHMQSSATVVRDAEQKYRQRRDMLIEALAERGVRAHGVSGLEVWIPLPTRVDEMGVVIRLMNSGWVVAPGKPMRIDSPPGLRVTIAELRHEDVEPFCDSLLEAVSPSGG